MFDASELLSGLCSLLLVSEFNARSFSESSWEEAGVACADGELPFPFDVSRDSELPLENSDSDPVRSKFGAEVFVGTFSALLTGGSTFAGKLDCKFDCMLAAGLSSW